MTDEQVLVSQPSAKPTRKVRIAGYATAALTIAVYVASAIGGEEVISEEALTKAITALGTALVPVVSAWLARSDRSDT
jgi:pyruvate/2-oxoacid:ferredoxin oxidoreductase beta subunit